MNDPLNTPEHYKATLREMATRLAYPGALSTREIVQNGKVAETLLFLLSKVAELEQRPHER